MSTIDQLEREIEAEFLDETRDVLSGLEVMLGNVESGLVDAAQAVLRLRKSFLALEARSQSLDNAGLAILAHRAFDFCSDLSELNRERVADVQVFIDVIRRLMDEGGDKAASAELVRQLPCRHIVDFDVAEAAKKTNIEVLLVVPDRATSHYVERELAACGYRLSNARSFFRGLEAAVRTKPDLVIGAAVLDDASGIDLARALAGISATANTPYALLTSFEPGHPPLAELPASAAVVRKGTNFGEDIANALAHFKIT